MRKHPLLLALSIQVPLLITTALWLWSKTRFPEAWLIDWPQTLSQLFALWGFVLLALTFVIAARSRVVEKLYGGLDKSYKTHGNLARIGLVLLIAHPLLLIFSGAYWGDAERIGSLFWFGDFVPKNLAIGSLYVFLVLTGLTVFRRLPYEWWRVTHQLMGIPFVMGGLHALGARSDVAAFPPLYAWTVFIMAVGTGAWLYKVLLYPFLARQRAYTVLANRPLGHGISELLLQPAHRKLPHEAGEFAFISFSRHPTLPAEHHPFSISSGPESPHLRFSYKTVGDYTRRLANEARPGDRVQVYGPYGEFTSDVFARFPRQIWIGAGIGITPFLSKLAHSATPGSRRKIHFYYLVAQPDEAVYAPEIEALLPSHPHEVIFRLHAAMRDGFITAERIAADAGGLAGASDACILMCGPPGVSKLLRRQFIALGVPANRIFFEEFDFV